jgi:hypothetical protein
MMLLNETLVRLRAEGLTVAEWGLGGSLRGVGLLDKLKPGLHAFVADDSSGEAEAVLCVGWDAPATEADVYAFFNEATDADVLERGGDETLVFSGTLDRVVKVAAAFVKAARA